MAAVARLASVTSASGQKRAGRGEPSGPRIVTASGALGQRGHRLLHDVRMIARDLSGRRHLVDDLRKDLRQPRAGVSVRKPELLRDLPDRSGAKHFLELTAGDRNVGARAYPGTDLAAVTALLKLADDPGQTAV